MPDVSRSSGGAGGRTGGRTTGRWGKMTSLLIFSRKAPRDVIYSGTAHTKYDVHGHTNRPNTRNVMYVQGRPPGPTLNPFPSLCTAHLPRPRLSSSQCIPLRWAVCQGATSGSRDGVRVWDTCRRGNNERVDERTLEGAISSERAMSKTEFGLVLHHESSQRVSSWG